MNIFTGGRVPCQIGPHHRQHYPGFILNSRRQYKKKYLTWTSCDACERRICAPIPDSSPLVVFDVLYSPFKPRPTLYLFGVSCPVALLPLVSQWRSVGPLGSGLIIPMKEQTNFNSGLSLKYCLFKSWRRSPTTDHWRAYGSGISRRPEYLIYHSVQQPTFLPCPPYLTFFSSPPSAQALVFQALFSGFSSKAID